ncbi:MULTISPECIES: hypothetical protein [Mesonia]|uniref:Uncharacterized protein n=1 Tax=Mesonia oceanica TaxID=2687242 RepID=A0AC61Y714_9FLAO|nr:MULTISPECIES: hypothetical protein [Mesonia]MAN26757.1 hypothetical protein [Mesonia sp.]MAQ40461.1 hypothetical protein [Mesonia sp.]MBJ98082.1 hypothetical protein [Flavobacteriaceae bacterium]VVV00299.1 hypothetical protein FVB9532_01568 [Mesonia oceanica]|tara:strand:- start:8 stop:343 length:336 start_codon:yes stop_codon:yes gene_type:complete
MSDFGAMIIFRKANSESFTDDDKNTIKSALKKVINKGNYSNLIKEGNYLNLKGWDNDKLCSLLTEYYIDENYDETVEFAKEEDLEDAKNISRQLQKELGDVYEVIASFEEW